MREHAQGDYGIERPRRVCLQILAVADRDPVLRVAAADQELAGFGNHVFGEIKPDGVKSVVK